MSDVKLYDVLVVCKTTQAVKTVLYGRLVLENGYYSARRWANTGRTRYSPDVFDIVIVNTGTHAKGDVLKSSEVVQ